MAITFVGFWNLADPAKAAAAQRDGDGGMPPELQERVRAFPAALHETVILIGSWGISGGDRPGVMVVEAEGFADLQAIGQHYAGWTNFEWHPTNTGGVPRD